MNKIIKIVLVLMTLFAFYKVAMFFKPEMAPENNSSANVQGEAQSAKDTRQDNETNQEVQRNASMTIGVATPTWQNLKLSFVVNGDVRPWQEAIIGSELQGAQLLDVLVDVGATVEKGQLLAQFSDDALQADYQQGRASVLQAKANYTNAKSNADRMRSIADKGIIAQQQIDAAYTQEEVAAMQLQAAQAALNALKIRLDNTKVIAPDSGIISARLATVGQVVGAGQELFKLIRQNKLEWRAQVTTNEVTKISVGDSAYLLLPDGSEVVGLVRSIAPIADADTRNITVFVDIPNHRQLRSGDYLSGRFEGGEERAMIVPNEAVVLRDGFNYVFKVDEQDTIHQLKVEVGTRFDGGAQIISGLEEGVRIAVEGAGFLNDGDFVRVVE